MSKSAAKNPTSTTVQQHQRALKSKTEEIAELQEELNNLKQVSNHTQSLSAVSHML